MIIGERLKSLLKGKKMTARQFAEMAGVTEGMVYKYYHLVDIDTSTARKWAVLLGVEPSYFLVDESPPVTTPASIVDKGNSPCEMVPLLPISSRAEGLESFLSGSKGLNIEHVLTPIRGADMVISVAGDSMAPDFPPGAHLVVKRINHKAFIEWGRVYVLDTINGLVIKRLLKGARADSVLCASVSNDPSFSPFEVALSDVSGVYSVLMSMTIR